MNTCFYREVHPPTGVTAAVSGNFTHTPSAHNPIPNLIVARTTQLDIFEVRSGSPGSPLSARSQAGKDGAAALSTAQGSRLELVGHYPLSGTVESMVVLKSHSPGTQRDALMLAFRNAKLCVLEWDSSRHELRTTSMHYFEGDPTLREGRKVFADPPRVLGDSQGRFAAMILYNHYLAILPAIEADQFKLLASLPSSAADQEAVLHEITALRSAGVPLGSAAALGNGYLLNLAKLGGGSGTSHGGARVLGVDGVSSGKALAVATGIKEVRDCVLLNGYTEPVLLILHQPDPTWPGRYKERKDTCVLTAVSLSIRRKKQTILWVSTGLPADAFALVAVPDKAAALLLCPNYILYCQQGSKLALSLNKRATPGEVVPPLEFNLGRETPDVTAARAARRYVQNMHPEVLPAVSPAARAAPGVDVDLRGARAAWVSTSCCLINLASSQQVAVHIRLDAPPDRRMQVTQLNNAPVASVLCSLSPGLLFLGSWSGDSLLLSCSLQCAGKTLEPEAGGPTKLRRLAGADASGAIAAEGEDDEEGQDSDKALVPYAGDPHAPPSIQLRTLDSLAGIGPIRDMLHIDTSTAAAAAAQGAEGAVLTARGGPTILAAIGNDKTGGIAVLRPGLITDIMIEVPLPAVHGMWTIHHRKEDVSAHMVGEDQAGTDSLDPVLQHKTQGAADFHAYLLLSCEDRKTMVLETGEELNEITGTASCITDQATVVAGNLFNLAGTCQVCPRCICVYDGLTPIQDLPVEELLLGAPAASVTIVSGQIMDPFVLLRLSNGQAVLLVGDEFSMTLSLCTSAAIPLYTRPSSSPSDLVTAACLYEDESRWMDELVSRLMQDKHKPQPNAVAPSPATHEDVQPEVQEEHDKAVREGEGNTAKHSIPLKPSEIELHSQITPAQPESQQHHTSPSDSELQQLPTIASASEPHQHPSSQPELEPQQQPPSPPNAEAPPHGRYSPQAGNGSGQFLTSNGPPTDFPAQAKIYLVLARRSGALEIYQLPDMELIFACSSLGIGHPLLSQSAEEGITTAGKVPGPSLGSTAAMMDHPAVRVVELCMASFKPAGPGSVGSCTRPVLLGLTASGNLLAYQAFDRGGGSSRAATHLQSAQQQQQHDNHSVQQGQGDVEMAQASGQGQKRARAQECSLADDGCADDGGASGVPIGNALAFKRLILDWTSHQEAAQGASVGSTVPTRLSRFNSISYVDPDKGTPGPKHSGFFVCGARPVWLFACRGTLVPHPMHLDGAVTTMTPFHNANCPFGFIVSTPGAVRVCNLPARERLDTPWALRKVRPPGGLGTVHRIAYMRECELLAVAVSRQVPFRSPFSPEEVGGDPHASAAYAAAAGAAEISSRQEIHEVRLLDLPGLSHAGCHGVGGVVSMEPGETVTALKSVRLTRHDLPSSALGPSQSDTAPLLAVGTSVMLGEDYPCLGRVALYQLQCTSSTGGKHADTREARGWRMTLVAQRDMAGPVAVLQDFKGMLLASVGKTVEVYSLRASTLSHAPPPVPRDSGLSAAAAAAAAAASAAATRSSLSLVKAAFYDMPLLVTSMAAVKDFLVVGDVHHGVSFLRYNESTKVLEGLSRDFECHDVSSVGFIINAQKLLFAATDANGTLWQYEYVKNHPLSWDGQRLLPGGSIHMGHSVTKLSSVKIASPDGLNRHALLLGTHSGGFGLWSPVWDNDSAARLHRLQPLLDRYLSHTGGLNPRTFRRRHLKIPRAMGGGETYGPQGPPEGVAAGEEMLMYASNNLVAETGSCILDGNLLWRFATLPRDLQQQLAQLVQARSPDQIMTDLSSLALATTL